MNCLHCQKLIKAVMHDSQRVYGNVAIEVLNFETGKIHREIIQNKIPSIGRFFIATLIKGATPAPTHLAVGTDNTAAADGDEGLATEVFRDFITGRIDITSGVRIRFFLPTTAANGNTLKEAAVMGPLPTQYLMARATHNDIIKTSSIAVNYSWDITLAQP